MLSLPAFTLWVLAICAGVFMMPPVYAQEGLFFPGEDGYAISLVDSSGSSQATKWIIGGGLLTASGLGMMYLGADVLIDLDARDDAADFDFVEGLGSGMLGVGAIVLGTAATFTGIILLAKGFSYRRGKTILNVGLLPNRGLGFTFRHRI